MSGPPPRGHVRLYTAIRPALLAGTYRLTATQRIEWSDGNETLPESSQSVHLVAPRFRMAGTELLNTFPPAYAQGPFSNRFAQVALKRRTLPWERSPGTGADGGKTPWLMLVVLAEGEGEFEPDTPLSSTDLAGLRQAIGLSAAQAAEAGNCDIVKVTGRIVRKCFPSRSDLPYLAHVREVNLLDTEAAAGDDDGFAAIVASNRVLRGGHNYTAFLVSVEGQLNVLQGPRETTDEIGSSTTTPTAPRPGIGIDEGVLEGGHLFGGHVVANVVDRTNTGRIGPVPRGHRKRVDGWEGPRLDEVDEAGMHLVEHELRPLANVSGSVAGGEVVDRVVVPPPDTEPGDESTHRFPVLAHWSFQTVGNGDFETVMRRLDVGLLGTVDATEDDAPTVVPTGHVLIERQTRQGEGTVGWYRGPLVPHELEDRDDVPLHAAEQALRIGSDGIEDLSYAAAFELGRLMALSDPRFVAALIAWRRGGSTRRWRKLSADRFRTDLLPPIPLDHFQLISVDLLDRLLGLQDPAGGFGPLGPLVNPVPWESLYDVQQDVGILQGIGMEVAQIEDALGVEVTSGFGQGPGLIVDAANPIGFEELADLGPGDMTGVLERHFGQELEGIQDLRGRP